MTRSAEVELIDAVNQLTEAIEDEFWTPVWLREGWVTINGQHIDIENGGAGEVLSVADRAKLSYKGGDKAEQDIARSTEKEMSAALGIPHMPDNEPFDLQNRAVGVEIKTMVSNSNDKITMTKDAIGRKSAEVAARGGPGKFRAYTVVVDKRTATTRYFIRAGFGSFRVGSMTEVPGTAGLRSSMRK